MLAEKLSWKMVLDMDIRASNSTNPRQSKTVQNSLFKCSSTDTRIYGFSAHKSKSPYLKWCF